MDAIYTEVYKGVKIEVIPDNDAQSPQEWGDNNLFLLAFHRSFTVENKNFEPKLDKDAVIALLENDRAEIKNLNCGDIPKGYHIFPLAAYIHSGVSLSLARTGQFADRFDSCYLGAVFVAKSEWKSKKAAQKAAAGYVNEWNLYLNGQVYGYNAEEAGASCWGFYGDYQTSGILDEARAEVDGYIKQQADKHAKTLKAYIKNGVPIEFRKPLNMAIKGA